MNWVQHADLYVLMVLLGYSVVIFLHVSQRCFLARRERNIDVPRRKSLVANLRTEAASVHSIAFSAPYLGLAGTCFGLFGVFTGFAMPLAAIAVVMATIGAAALITTAAGIVVSVFATWFYNCLCLQIDVLASEVHKGALGGRLPLQKRFSQLPPFALIAAPALAIAFVAYVSLGRFRDSKGLAVEFASARCEYAADDGDDRLIVLRITNADQIFLNNEPETWQTLRKDLAEIYRSRKYRALYLVAEDDVSFQSVADAIDIAQNTPVASNSLNIEVRLVTPQAMNAKCVHPLATHR